MLAILLAITIQIPMSCSDPNCIEGPECTCVCISNPFCGCKNTESTCTCNEKTLEREEEWKEVLHLLKEYKDKIYGSELVEKSEAIERAVQFLMGSIEGWWWWQFTFDEVEVADAWLRKKLEEAEYDSISHQWH